jgi:hypothetical protein
MNTLYKLYSTLALLVACLVLPGMVMGQHTLLDLTLEGNSADHNNARFIAEDASEGAGTGLLDPFARTKSNVDIQAMMNTGNATVQFETEDGPWTTSLLLSTITDRDLGPDGIFKEFILDINQTHGARIYPINEVQVWADDQTDLNCYNPDPTATGADPVGGGQWGDCDTGDDAIPVFWLDRDFGGGFPGTTGDATIILDYLQQSGSGNNADMSMLLPLAAFPDAENCSYGSSTCDTYIYVYARFGAAAECDGFSIVDGNQTYECEGNDDGFEEWSTLIEPFVQISKTADGLFDETHTWDITKTVSPDECNMFAGDECTVEYEITVDETVGVGSSSITGVITLHVPAKLPDGDEASPAADILTLVDHLEDGGNPVGTPLDADDLSCAYELGGAFDYTTDDIGPGETVLCSYSFDSGFDPESEDIINHVAATIDLSEATFSASHAVTFTPNLVGFDEVNVTDDNAGIEAPSQYGPWDDGEGTTYTRTFECDGDEGGYTNTATIDETGDSDDATVTIICYELAVTKDATPRFAVDYDWTVTKSVDPDSWALFAGESGTSEYTVTWTRTPVPGSYGVSGNIVVSNPSPIDAVVNVVTDVISGPVPATVDCGGAGPYPILAGGTLDCTYDADLSNDDSRTNTATATQQNYSYDEFGVGTPSGTTDYSGDAAVNFAGVEPTETNATATLDDTYAGAGLPSPVSAGGSDTYTRTFECDGDEGSHDNTVTLDPSHAGPLTDDASVTVACYSLAVTKDAETTFTREWDWDITKRADDGAGGDLTALLLSDGQTYGIPYEVEVSVTGFTDSDWAVSGNIWIANSHPTRAAELTDVADIVSPDIVASVNCPGSSVPAGGQLACTYSTGLPDGTNRTNTATATQQLYDFDEDLVATPAGTEDYSGNADVIFGDPTTLVDYCTDVSDSLYGNLGTLCVDAAPHTFNYVYETTVEVGFCGEYSVDNTATQLEEDTGDTSNAVWSITVTVECPEGCTLTQGYWKTHNESFAGGAPPDDNWYNVPDALPYGDGDTNVEAELEPFFLSGDTWFGVFWTAPKGNAYYNLAHQWMAAYLNTLNGAGLPAEVATALADAQDYLETYGPDNTSGKGKNKNAEVSAQLIAWAGILAAYNEGDYGIEHCDEDATSDVTVSGLVNVAGSVEAAISIDGVSETPTEARGTIDVKAVEGDESSTGEVSRIDAAPAAVEIPSEFAVGNYPNPFNPVTTIQVALPEASHVRVAVYDVLGRMVELLVDGQLSAGTHSVTFDAGSLPSGVYLYRFEHAGGAITKTMQLLK